MRPRGWFQRDVRGINSRGTSAGFRELWQERPLGFQSRLSSSWLEKLATCDWNILLELIFSCNIKPIISSASVQSACPSPYHNPCHKRNSYMAGCHWAKYQPCFYQIRLTDEQSWIMTPWMRHFLFYTKKFLSSLVLLWSRWGDWASGTQTPLGVSAPVLIFFTAHGVSRQQRIDL